MVLKKITDSGEEQLARLLDELQRGDDEYAVL